MDVNKVADRLNNLAGRNVTLIVDESPGEVNSPGIITGTVGDIYTLGPALTVDLNNITSILYLMNSIEDTITYSSEEPSSDISVSLKNIIAIIPN